MQGRVLTQLGTDPAAHRLQTFPVVIFAGDNKRYNFGMYFFEFDRFRLLLDPNQ